MAKGRPDGKRKAENKKSKTKRLNETSESKPSFKSLIVVMVFVIIIIGILSYGVYWLGEDGERRIDEREQKRMEYMKSLSDYRYCIEMCNDLSSSTQIRVIEEESKCMIGCK